VPFGILYLICAIISFVLVWVIRVSIVRKYNHAHTFNEYLQIATWAEMIIIAVVSLIPVINVFLAGATTLFMVTALLYALFTEGLNKPIRRKEQ
jgi:uncharacterized membrane protein